MDNESTFCGHQLLLREKENVHKSVITETTIYNELIISTLRNILYHECQSKSKSKNKDNNNRNTERKRQIRKTKKALKNITKNPAKQTNKQKQNRITKQL